MRHVVLALAVSFVGFPAAVPVQQAPKAVSAWVAAPAAGADAAVAYVAIENPTMYDIYITAATTDAAKTVELRAGATGGGEPAVVTEFTVPAYGSTAAEQAAPHLRLVQLTRPLAAGDTVQLTLTTDGGVALNVAAPVK
ncbi:MAG: copper chaperone PCu(A)C [Vicinamibacterales bacterium]